MVIYVIVVTFLRMFLMNKFASTVIPTYFQFIDFEFGILCNPGIYVIKFFLKIWMQITQPVTTIATS